MFAIFYYCVGLLLLVAVFFIAIVLVRIYVDRKVQRSAKGRSLFQFSDGVNLRAVDPIQVLEAMESHPQYRFDVMPQRVAEGEKEAIAVTVDAVRNAFGVTPFVKVGLPGLTNNECLQLLNAFTIWIVNQKKSTEPKST